ncbi:MAG: hypothetical protein HYX60_09025 [Legionella longbeachae]|nr:hypothetical protein [Legionella longbeachae]
MIFTYEQIIKLENPYEAFSNGDALAENAEVLNALSNKEKNILATKIISDCPMTKFKNYGLQIEALRNLTKKDGSFHSVISEAYQVRQSIFSLFDPRNKAPHSLLIGEEFNPTPFHRFSELAKNVLKNNEPAIAERLALCAPGEVHSQIARNIDIVFPKSALTTKMQVAFTLHRNIKQFLLGDNPEKFFSSRDFNHDTCNMFANMFRSLLKDHEEEIGTKLGTLKSAEVRIKILHQLELLSTEVFDQANPFKQIAEVIRKKQISEDKENTSLANNPNGLFAKSTIPLSNHISLEELLLETGIENDDTESFYSEDSENEKDSDRTFSLTPK